MQATTTPMHLEIKKQVRRRDKKKCVECGMTEKEHRNKYSGRNLHVHRIAADGAYSLENCETLCQGCHGKHRRKINGIFKSLKPGIMVLSVELEKVVARQLHKHICCWPTYESANELVARAIKMLCKDFERNWSR